MTAQHPPCLYLLWPTPASLITPPKLPGDYALRVYRDRDEHEMLDLQGSDGEPMSEAEWRQYRDLLLPAGLFLIEHLPDRRLVGTAGAVHNPNPGRYYFPSGGELAYLVVR